ncbi:CPBP family intramembrane glutamic endopeptidase [Microbacterium sp. NPDC056234]|uniref:CPBP family intramembrane glutamic endopeptidase n=1 Tax=Microbacterium sp. NPDC056234 TaxID=3345757 RepID=UPI0035DA5FC3
MYVFFVLTGFLSVPFLALGALIEQPLIAGLPFSALQFLAPLAAAVILVSRREGTHGMLRIALEAIDVRQAGRPRILLPVLLIMPLIYSASYVLMIIGGQQLPQWRVAGGQLLLLAVLFFFSAACEEIGWTGYALSPLLSRYGAVMAALVIGVAWALFHVTADLQGGHSPEWILWHRVSTVALRVIIVVAYIGAQSSLFAAITVHTMDNVSWASFPNGGSHYDPSVTAPVALAAAALALLGLRKWRRETLRPHHPLQ